MFWFCLVLLAIVVWASVPFLFRPLGRFLTDIYNDIKKAFKEDKENE